MKNKEQMGGRKEGNLFVGYHDSSHVVIAEFNDCEVITGILLVRAVRKERIAHWDLHRCRGRACSLGNVLALHAILPRA